VNLAGVEIVLNMRRKIEQMQKEVGSSWTTSRGAGAGQPEGWKERFEQALVKLPPPAMPEKSEEPPG
jgi:hypothetical protein